MTDNKQPEQTREIPMRELVEFCTQYNSFGYGEAEIIELKSAFIVKLYNAGFSENEALDIEFRQKYPNDIIYNNHPIMIVEFSKLNLNYGTHVVGFGNMKDWCDCYEKQKKFTFLIEIE